MNLKKELRQLVQLQEIDTKIYKLQEDKDKALPIQLEKIKKEFEEMSKNFTTAEEKFKKLQLEKKDKELELATKEGELKKLQTQLYQLKSNKDYQAMLTTIGSNKADMLTIEEAILIIMESLEEATKECTEQKEALGQEEKSFKDQEVRLTESVKNAEIDISNLNNKRKVIAEGIDKKILSDYERLLVSRKGLALVPVKGNGCGACHMRLNHQKINEIKMLEHLAICESCVRILYIPEDIQE